ncbi:MAG: TonB-dependent receptor plug domain-containing protein, partial [Pseudomonadota bacterium]
MKKLFLCGAAVAALGWNVPASAQDVDVVYDESDNENIILPIGRVPIIVSATRAQGVSVRRYTGTYSRVIPNQIKQRQVRDIADVLRDVPGVAVSSVAGQTQIRLRGSEANHVLVLVDGIEVSDPFAGEFDIGTLQADIGSRLEVLR